jgi:hypothetical protein
MRFGDVLFHPLERPSGTPDRPNADYFLSALSTSRDSSSSTFWLHHFCPWDIITGIVVINEQIKPNVEQFFTSCDTSLTRQVAVKRVWYY